MRTSTGELIIPRHRSRHTSPSSGGSGRISKRLDFDSCDESEKENSGAPEVHKSASGVKTPAGSPPLAKKLLFEVDDVEEEESLRLKLSDDGDVAPMGVDPDLVDEASQDFMMSFDSLKQSQAEVPVKKEAEKKEEKKPEQEAGLKLSNANLKRIKQGKKMGTNKKVRMTPQPPDNSKQRKEGTHF